MRFRLTTIAYAFALLAAAMATFGPWGIATAFSVAAFWFFYYRRAANPVAFWLCVVVLGCLTAQILLPAISSARSAAKRSHCLSNIKELYIALENYHHKHGSYPPAYLADSQGTPIHSWRVLLLPYLGENELYRHYDFDEPWNGPNNRKLWDRMPEVYACPAQERRRSLGDEPFGPMPRHAANYFAVVDESTAWPGARPLKSSEITDDAGETILLIEYSGSTDPWTAPVDLTLDEAAALFETSDPKGHLIIDENLDFFMIGFERSLYATAFADGRVQTLRSAMGRDLARAMFTVAGREVLTQWFNAPSNEDSTSITPRRVTIARYEHVYAAAVFAILALLPGYRLFTRTAAHQPFNASHETRQ